MKKLLCGAIAFGLMGSMNAVQAQAASVSGTTDFQVEIPEILILYHWDTAILDFKDFSDKHNDDRIIAKTDALLSDANHTIGTTATDKVKVDTVPNGFDANKLISVKLQDAWAVRSITEHGVDLKLAIQKSDLYLDGLSASGSKAVVSNASFAENTTEITKSMAPGWNPKYGSIFFKLNLSGVTKAGRHKTAGTAADATDVFKLTLSGRTSAITP